MTDKSVEILLVEDNPNDVELTLHAFRKNNHIQVVRDGAEALDFIFCRGVFCQNVPDEHPKVILLDLKLPKVDGIEVLREIKKNEKTQKIPIVVLTSSREDQDVDECYRLGVNSYIVKPVEFEKFVDAVSVMGMYWLLINQPSTD
jgi:two-component system response regulator